MPPFPLAAFYVRIRDDAGMRRVLFVQMVNCQLQELRLAEAFPLQILVDAVGQLRLDSRRK